MKVTQILKPVFQYLWRVPLCAVAYMVGTMAGARLVSALGMSLPEIPEQADEKAMGLGLIIGSVVLAVAVAPLARRIRARYGARWLILAALCYVCIGVNTPLEAAIFTSLGGMWSMVVFSTIPCLFFAAAVALLFKPSTQGEPFIVIARRFFSGRSAGAWAGRLAGAVCAFPVVYWTFGMMIAPFVLPYYRQEQFGLALPGAGVVVLVQFVRSLIFLAAALPILIVWSGSRFRLTLVLGLAFYVLVGLFVMIQSHWLAPTLLVLHNVEILADSMVYALALAVLLGRGDSAKDEALVTWPRMQRHLLETA